MAHAPMFFTQVPSFLKGRGLISTDKMVFGTIYTMLNITDYCCMSNKKIAEEVEIKPQTVSTIISKLRKKGLIKVRIIYKKDSKQIDKRLITLGDLVYKNQGVTPYDSHHIPPYDESHIPPRRESKGNRLFNRLKPEEENMQLKTYKAAWLESEKMSPLTAKKLIELCNKHGQDLFDYAINLSVESNVTFNKSYRYLNSILTDWSKNGVKDVTGAKKYVKGRKKKAPRKNSYGHKPVKEDLPDWAKESDEDKKARRDKEKAEHAERMKNDPEYRRKSIARDKELEANLKKIQSWRKQADE